MEQIFNWNDDGPESAEELNRPHQAETDFSGKESSNDEKNSKEGFDEETVKKRIINQIKKGNARIRRSKEIK